jgi:hypothetical protein
MEQLTAQYLKKPCCKEHGEAMYHVLDTHQFALQEQGGADYERCAKIKEWKMIIDAELVERRQHVLWVSTRRSARESTLLALEYLAS